MLLTLVLAALVASFLYYRYAVKDSVGTVSGYFAWLKSIFAGRGPSDPTSQA